VDRCANEFEPSPRLSFELDGRLGLGGRDWAASVL
jgi:hypothetical protein